MSINDVINKSDAKVKKTRMSSSDFIFCRIMALFAVLVAYIIFELCAHNSGADLAVMDNAAKISAVIFAIAAAAFLAVRFYVKKNGVFGIGRMFSAGFIACVCAALSVFLGLTYHISESGALIILAFAAVALAFIGYSFSRDFFLLSVITVISLVLSMWPRLFIYNTDTLVLLSNYGSVAASFVVSAAFCVLAAVACYGKSAKFSRWFFNLGYVRLYPLYLLPAVGFAASLVRLFAPAMFSYAIIVTVVTYMIFLVMYAFDSAK